MLDLGEDDVAAAAALRFILNTILLSSVSFVDNMSLAKSSFSRIEAVESPHALVYSLSCFTESWSNSSKFILDTDVINENLISHLDCLLYKGTFLEPVAKPAHPSRNSITALAAAL